MKVAFKVNDLELMIAKVLFEMSYKSLNTPFPKKAKDILGI